LFFEEMSTAGSASNSPSAGRRNRPEVQLYIPGKTRLSKEKVKNSALVIFLNKKSFEFLKKKVLIFLKKKVLIFL